MPKRAGAFGAGSIWDDSESQILGIALAGNTMWCGLGRRGNEAGGVAGFLNREIDPK